MSDSLRPRVLQPSRLLWPWDFQDKNTGVGCHFLLLSDPGIKPTSLPSPALAGKFFTTSATLRRWLCFHQFSSVTQSFLNVCNPMHRSTPGLPVHHQLPESTQTHVLWVSDAIQPYHPLLSPSPPAFNLSQHQGLFQRVSCLHQVAKVLELQHLSSQWILMIDLH